MILNMYSRLNVIRLKWDSIIWKKIPNLLLMSCLTEIILFSICFESQCCSVLGFPGGSSFLVVPSLKTLQVFFFLCWSVRSFHLLKACPVYVEVCVAKAISLPSLWTISSWCCTGQFIGTDCVIISQNYSKFLL